MTFQENNQDGTRLAILAFVEVQFKVNIKREEDDNLFWKCHNTTIF